MKNALLFSFTLMFLLLNINLFSQQFVFEKEWGGVGGGEGLFLWPINVAVDSEDNVYVTDPIANKVQKFTSDGEFITMWGGRAIGEFHHPIGIAVNSSQIVYVADYTRIQKFDDLGNYISEWDVDSPISIEIADNDEVYILTENGKVLKYSSTDILIQEWGVEGESIGELSNPNGIAVDGDGFIYITDRILINNQEQINYVRVQKFTNNGQFIVGWNLDPTCCSWGPTIYDLDVDENGFVYVSSPYNHQVMKYTDEGVFVKQIGTQGTGIGDYDHPNGITLDNNGNLYIADTEDKSIQKFTTDGSFINKWGSYGSVSEGYFQDPFGITYDKKNDVIYVSDFREWQISKFSKEGEFITWFGRREDFRDGRFYLSGISTDSLGNVYSVESYNGVTKYDSEGNIIITHFGEYNSGDGALRAPNGISIDADNHIYVVDGNLMKIKKYDDQGNFILSWGKKGEGSDEFYFPYEVYAGNDGYIYVVDQGNYDPVVPSKILKFTNDGSYIKSWEINSIGTSDIPGYGITLDSDGHLFIADSKNDLVKEYTSDGEFVTQFGGSGSNPGQFYRPAGITIDDEGYLYTTESYNQRVQKFRTPYVSFINVTSPNGGENWAAGSNQNITWSSSSVENIEIEYTIDNGSNWLTIVSSTSASTGSYIWTVPNTTSTNCKIKITNVSDQSIFDVSDEIFTIPDLEREALTALYNSTNGDNWTNNSNWLSDEPLGDWYGVTVVDGQVTGIFLTKNNLFGPIPTEIGNLTSLTHLYLYSNQLTGTIPTEIGNLAALTNLELGGNRLSGSIPTEIFNLTSLTGLWLYNNQLTGTIPPAIGNLTALTGLWLDGNQLTGTIPSEIGNLTSLAGLWLNWNQFTGTIPTEIGNLTALTHLNLDGNQLTGTIPTEIGNLTSLTDLVFQDNRLTSAIPTEIGNLTELIHLDIGNNQLTSAIPAEIGNLTELTYLDLGSNSQPGNQLTGEIPPEIGNLSALTILRLDWNQLTGTIPLEIGNLVSLIDLHLDNNQLSGIIPPEIGNLDNLNSIVFSSNQLSGSIPPEIGNLTALHYLGLEDNRLSGTIPTEIGNLTELTALFICCNQLTGVIPLELWNLTNLVDLSLGGEFLEGEIPAQIYNLTNLEQIEFYPSPNLSWPITSQISDLNKLRFLSLYGIKLSNGIPPEIGNLINLDKLSLTYTSLSGSVPSQIGNLANLRQLHIDNNNLSGNIPFEINNLNKLLELSIQDNSFENLPFLSGLDSLQLFHASNNKFEFDDFEPNMSLNIPDYTYAPQDSIGTKIDTLLNFGDSFSYSILVGGENNHYKWFLDGNQIANAPDTSFFIIDSVNEGSTGVYNCEITNTVVTGLTLYSKSFTVRMDGNITVSSPNGGENWQTGSGQQIEWISRGIDNVKIDLSTNNGTDWQSLVSSFPANAGRYIWTVPDVPPSNVCLVKITDISNPDNFDESDSPFSISVPQNPTVEVISPNGTEDWLVGSSHQIMWSSENIDNVKISYSTNNGNSWPVIETSVFAANGSYEWVIPNTPSDECLVMVADVSNENISDHSDGMFTINAQQVPLITIVNPNGGEAWTVGATERIEWTSNLVNNVKIEYSTNTGSNWTIVTSSAPSTGSYDWVIPNAPSAQCMVKITDAANNSISDVSNGLFMITTQQSANINVLTPNGSEEWMTGESYDVEWSSENVNNVEIEYSTDSGLSWLAVISSISANAGAYSWTIPNTPSSNCFVKISNKSNPDIYDDSDGIFSISLPSANIILTSLNVGEIILGGSEKQITWESENVENVKIELSTDSGTNWSSITNSTSASTGNYNWSVPNLDAANCRLRISDAANEYLFDESDSLFTVFNYSPTITISASLNYFSSNSQPSYRIIGLPGSANLPIDEVLSGNYGEDWRAFYDSGADTDYLVEYNGTNEFNFRPGRGFWVINRNNATINEDLNNVILSSDYTYTISLHSGWNIISNPFKKSISWSEIQSLNSTSRDIHWFNGSNYEQNSEFEYYKGYYLYNADNLNSLDIPYIGTNRLAKSLAKDNSNPASELKISLENGEQSLTNIVLGIAKDAKTGLDEYDKFTPRGDFVKNRITIFNENLETNYKYLRKDYRAEIGDLQIYDLFIETETNKSLTLSTEGIENFEEYNIYLIDTRLNNVYDLRDGRTDFQSVHNSNEFKLIIGKAEYTEEFIEDLLPKEFVLYQNYPNPFSAKGGSASGGNPSTTIRYSIPEKRVVNNQNFSIQNSSQSGGSNYNITLKIYDILGSEVATLVNEFQPPGTYEVEFSAVGGSLSSGVYFYKLTAGEFTKVNKMILIK